MATVTWKIENTEYDIASGAVSVAHWRVIATEEGQTVTAYGSAGFSADPEDENFIPLENLTEAIVLGWVKDSLEVDAIEAGLVGNLATLITPSGMSGLPWQSEIVE